MNISNGDAIKLLETTSLADLARDFISRFGEEIGTENAVKAKLQRLKSSRPKKGSAKYTDWSVKPFIQSTCTTDLESEESPAVLGRPKSRLSDLPKRRTVNQIMQPKIDELMQFAEEQGVSIEEVMELMGQRCQKKARTIKVEIPIEDSLGFFFNSTHSSRSWTELR